MKLLSLRKDRLTVPVHRPQIDKLQVYKSEVNKTFVSIIIPCRNEKDCIGKCLDSIISNDYPKDCLEILVVDGISEDGTRDIVMTYIKQHPFIKLIDNHKLMTANALNIGIKNASGDLIIIMGAHTFYCSNYVSQMVKGSLIHEADAFGGVVKVLPGASTIVARALAVANCHRFTVGNAYYRTGSHKVRRVDTVPFGCYRREIFDRIGYFNTKLIRAQDREFNARLRQKGGIIILNPKIKSTYMCRSKFWDYFKWIGFGGYWVFYASRFTHTKIRLWRNYIPLTFLLYHPIALLSYYLLPMPLTIAVISPLAFYGVLVFYFSVRLALQKKELFFLPLLLIIFTTSHYAYAFGSLIGFFKMIVFGKESQD